MLGSDKSYFVNKDTLILPKRSLKRGRVFNRQSMGTHCEPLLALKNLLLYSYEAYFIQRPLMKNEKNVGQSAKKSLKTPNG